MGIHHASGAQVAGDGSGARAASSERSPSGLSGGGVLYLLKNDSPEPIRLHWSVGRRLPACATGLGKALLSEHLPMLKKLYPDG